MVVILISCNTIPPEIPVKEPPQLDKTEYDLSTAFNRLILKQPKDKRAEKCTREYENIFWRVKKKKLNNKQKENLYILCYRMKNGMDNPLEID